MLVGSYSGSDIQDYFEYIIKKHETVTDNPSIRIYVKKIENRIIFKIKTGYYLKLLKPERMKLIWSTKNNTTKDENGENSPHLENTEVVLSHCNICSKDDQYDSRVFYTFFPNKSFGQLLDNSHKNVMFLKTFNSELLHIEV